MYVNISMCSFAPFFRTSGYEHGKSTILAPSPCVVPTKFLKYFLCAIDESKDDVVAILSRSLAIKKNPLI
jgi:hypothetical protein